ncbi:MAG: cytochrome c3 family protein [Bryobacterales bacterium]|nr:cytochrome c3 family protein [Bryobacterales bacterium]
MAHYVQGLAASFLLAGALAATDFSHKQHTALKLSCVACHSSVPASTRAEDNSLPNAAFCATCHKENTPVISPPRRSLVTRFNHQLHLKLGNTAPVIAAAIDSGKYLSPVPAGYRELLNTANPCLACHAGIDQADSLSHSYLPPMASCLVCHNKVDPPFSCPLCHAGITSLKPASHTPDYIDKHSSGKANLDKPSCAVCHGRKFTCLGCH